MYIVCLHIVCGHTYHAKSYSTKEFCYTKKALPCKRGGVHMALTILSLVGTFILSVIAGVVANYITDNLKR